MTVHYDCNKKYRKQYTNLIQTHFFNNSHIMFLPSFANIITPLLPKKNTIVNYNG